MTLADQLHTIKNLIREYELRYARTPGSVGLLAASKGKSIEAIQEIIAADQFILGENYLQEALLKMSAISNPNIEWHFIGPIQSNKTKKMAEHFSWVQTVSDKKIAKRLNDQRPNDLPPLNICLQINISHEMTKSGVTPEQVVDLATYCSTLPRLRLRGLMTIPAIQKTFEEQRVPYRALKKIFDELNQNGFSLDILSMGMTDDMEAAIAEGATLVRIGTGIFGRR